MDLVELSPRPIMLRARTTNRYVPALRVIVSDLALAGRRVDVVWLTREAE